jgi:flagellar basal-body rod protein FlgF
MIDKALFLGTSGAKNSMHKLEIITNNLANVNTTGFRGDYELSKQFQVGDDSSARTYEVSDKSYSDFTLGPIIHTDRDLDVSLVGEGFIAVQGKTGKESYTRAGDLQVKDGMLTTRSGDLVLGAGGGVINVGPAERIMIGTDGTISARIKGETGFVAVNRIKLATPPLQKLQKAEDGLFVLKDGSTEKQNDSVRITTGTLEGSNVNPVETLTSLIQVSRDFELHTNLMKTMTDEASKANSLLDVAR